MDNSGIERYVDRCTNLPQLFSPGERWSYSNTGYVVLGRMIEVLTGLPWAQAIVERVFQPLHQSHSMADPAELLRFRAAMGHVFDSEASELKPAPMCFFSKSMAPAGSVVMQSSSDLLVLGRVLLDGGRLPDGKPWLSAESLERMLKPQIELPRHNALDASAWGLGTVIYDDGSIGHGGQTFGQSSELRVLRDEQIVIALQTNGQSPATANLLKDLYSELYCLLSGVSQDTKPLQFRGIEIAIRDAVLGVYESSFARIEVTWDGESLMMNVHALAGVIESTSNRLCAITDEAFAAFDNNSGERQLNVNFLTSSESDKVEFLFYGGRLCRRIA